LARIAGLVGLAGQSRAMPAGLINRRAGQQSGKPWSRAYQWYCSHKWPPGATSPGRGPS